MAVILCELLHFSIQTLTLPEDQFFLIVPDFSVVPGWAIPNRLQPREHRIKGIVIVMLTPEFLLGGDTVALAVNPPTNN